MTQVEAIYENGVLRPLSPLALEEHERVEVIIRPKRKVLSWDEVRQHLEEMRQKVGTLPDSTPLIAEGRYSGAAALEALKRVSEGREKLRQKIGTLPDSTPLIREDRMRDI